MKRYRVDFGYGRYYFEPNEAGDWVRFEDHEAIIQCQASAALAGMNAAKAISSNDLQRAARLRAESSPDALESERQANALLTAENEQLREVIARCYMRLQCADVPREPWHWEVCNVLDETGACSGVPQSVTTTGEQS